MRILAFADTHGDDKAMTAVEKKAQSADILLCAGDVTVFEKNIRNIIARLDKIGKKILIIHGNHEDYTVLSKIAKVYKNINCIHKKQMSYRGYTFIGYGGGGFSQKDKTFDDFAKTVEIKTPEKTVVMTHGPPYKTDLDYVDGESSGSKSYAAYMKKYQPFLWICGHIHENEGKTQLKGKTLLVNPGPSGLLIEL